MSVLVLRGDARRLPLPDASVDLIVTSPPYFGLRSYTDGGEHYDGQTGSEATPGEYVAALVGCTREWVRVLKPCGSLFVNLGDKYAGVHPGAGRLIGQESTRQARAMRRDYPTPGIRDKSLLGLPWRYALAATDQLGLILRAEIIWAKPNGLPESVTDRVRRAHEQVFHFTRLPRYYSAVDEIREPHVYPAGNGQGYTRKGAGDASGHDRQQNMRGTVRDVSPLGKLPGSVWDDTGPIWHIPSQPLTVPPALGIDHFAAFPMELPRRIIGGWSPPGVCCECGEGRRPVVDRRPMPAVAKVLDHRVKTMKDISRNDHETNISGQEFNRWRSANPVTITGYACACTTTDLPGPKPPSAVDPLRPARLAPADRARKSLEGRAGELPPTRPAVVLDPFGGTGTTALLAHALGRCGITVDRSADYCRLATWRTSDPGELARALQVPKPPPVPEGMDRLF